MALHQNGHAKTGLSDSVSPGDISNLSKSSALAFTVEFFGDKPAQKDLYWRGLVLSHYDGETWTREDAPENLLPEVSYVTENKKNIHPSLVNVRLESDVIKAKKHTQKEWKAFKDQSSQSFLYSNGCPF